MNMSWLESLVYGLISGISEFIPVSSFAHQQIIMHLFGVADRDPVRDFFVHIGMFVAVFTACRSFVDVVRRENAASGNGRHSIIQNSRVLRDWKLIRSAIIPLIVGMILLRYILNLKDNLLLVTLFMVVNGIILFIPNRMVQSNKSAASMSAFDSLLIGCSGALSVLPGVSRIACTYGISVARGAAKKSALHWSLVLSIYALACLCVMDLFAIFSASDLSFWGNFFTYILSGLAAYAGGSVGIYIMRYIIGRPSGDGFAYYCWGASLFSFILYLTVA